MDTQIYTAAQAAAIDVNAFFAVVFGIPLLLVAIYYGVQAIAWTVGFIHGFYRGFAEKPKELTAEELADFETRLHRSLGMQQINTNLPAPEPTKSVKPFDEWWSEFVAAKKAKRQQML